MLKKLQKKWGVNGSRLFLILLTFAMGGSACGWITRNILLLLFPEKNLVWYLTYFILLTLLWPPCVLLVSLPLGQFLFFKNYILRIWGKITKKGVKTGKK